jgi:cupin fold WbuC family metalloprotein
MNITVFSTDYFNDLAEKAAGSPRRRQNRNVHASYADLCQRMFNAIEPDSYLPPHRHSPLQGNETMVAVRGLLALVIFDDFGRITESLLVGAGLYTGREGVAAGADIPPLRWHTILALESASILLEVKAGPFDPHLPKEVAPWAPEEGTPDAHHYHQNLMESIRPQFEWLERGK